MGKPSDQPGFKALLKEWNRKLSDSGFCDIEEMRGGQLQLKKSGTEMRFKRMDTVRREAKAAYFDLVGEKLTQTPIENETERQVLYFYAEGVSQADIKRRMGIEGHRCKVYRPIYKWLKHWGIKK